MNFQTKDYIELLYNKRFNKEELTHKRRLWKILVREFLSKHIDKTDSVLDVGSGYCEFINNVDAADKYVIDTNPEVRKYADKDVHVIEGDIFKVDKQVEELKPVDCIFISNFFEHLSSVTPNQVIQVLDFCYSKMKKGGKLLIIQPNFKFCYKDYYDFIDHHIPLTHLSMKEAIEVMNFKIEIMHERFLPFTTKGARHSPGLLKLYLMMPVLWKFFGKQMFIKAVK